MIIIEPQELTPAQVNEIRSPIRDMLTKYLEDKINLIVDERKEMSGVNDE